MALYAFLRSNPNATMSQIEDSFDGNLCRCTGYRSILDGAKTFGSDYDEKAPTKSPTGQRLCPGTGMPCYCARVPDTHERGETKVKFDKNGTEPIFPPALKAYNAEPLRLTDAQQTSVWYRPTKLDDLLRLKRHNEARIVVGATEVAVEVYLKRGKQPYKIMISPAYVPEMNVIKVGATGITFGAAVSLSRVSEFLKEQIAILPAEKTENFKAVVEQLKWFAGHQIRNAACLGGNIATASPISDINPVLVAAGAELTVASMEQGSKVVPMDRSFFKGYRVTAMHPHEVIVSIHIPFTEKVLFLPRVRRFPFIY
jgi:xanthine dehydrogenase/oxidase